MTCVCGHSREQHLHADRDAETSLCTGTGPLGLGGCACAGYTEEPRCDFCSGMPAPWTYPARSAAMPTLGGPYSLHVSVTDWAACEECYALIEARQRVKLAHRIQLSEKLTPKQLRAARLQLLSMHAIQFWSVRDGPPYRH